MATFIFPLCPCSLASGPRLREAQSGFSSLPQVALRADWSPKEQVAQQTPEDKQWFVCSHRMNEGQGSRSEECLLVVSHRNGLMPQEKGPRCHQPRGAPLRYQEHTEGHPKSQEKSRTKSEEARCRWSLLHVAVSDRLQTACCPSCPLQKQTRLARVSGDRSICVLPHGGSMPLSGQMGSQPG
jgi:hypothetical protein